MAHDQLSMRVTKQLKALRHASEAQRYQILRSIRTQLDPSDTPAVCCDDALLGECIRGFRKWGGDNAAETVQAFSRQRDNIRLIRKSLSMLQDPSIPLSRISFNYHPLGASGKLHVSIKSFDPAFLSVLQVERERQAAIGWGGFLPFLNHLLGHFPPDDTLIALKTLVEGVAWSLNPDNEMQWLWGLFVHQDQGLIKHIYLSFFEDGTGEDTLLATPVAASEAGEHLKASLKRARWAAARYLRQLSTDFDAASLMSYDMLLKIGDHYHSAGFEGGSLSLPVAVMLVAHALQLPMPQNVALTGDIDTEAMVQPVNGVNLKVRAAMEGNLSCVVIPAGNMMDIRHIPVGNIEIFGVRSLEDACNYLFRDALRDAGYQAFPIEAVCASTFTPFAGRRHELVRLQQQINMTLSGQGGLTIIQGDAGVGKTRLLEEVRQYALDAGLFVLTGACLYRRGAIPYWPFIDALKSMDSRDRRLAGKDWPERIAEIKVLLKNAEDMDARILQVQLFDQILSLVEILTDTSGAVICIEDLQWSDSVTLQLVHHLSRQAKNRRVRLIVTYRSEEVVSEDQQTGVYPLAVLQQCRTEGLSDTLALYPLNESECGMLVAVLVKNRFIPVWFTDRVYKETQGNPLFIVELIKWWQEQGLIQEGRVGIDWQVFEDQQDIVPPRILDVIAHRLRPLADEERALLDIAAVGGEQFDMMDVLAISNGDRIRIMQYVQRLEKKYGILKHMGRNIYQFTHSKIQEYIYSNQSKILQKEYHRLWGLMLLSRKEAGEEVPVERLATHLYHGNDEQAALPYLMEAGERAQKLCTYLEAHWYLEQANILIEDRGVGHDGDKIKVLLELSRVYYELGHWETALECNHKVINQSRKDDLSFQARAQSQIGAIFIGQNKWDLAKKYFRQSTNLYKKMEDMEGVAVNENYLGNLAYQQSQWDIALRHYQRTLDIVTPLKHNVKIAGVSNNLGLVYLALGNDNKAIYYYKISNGKHKEMDNIQGIAEVDTNLGMVYERIENWDEAIKYHFESVGLFERMGNTRHLCIVYVNYGRCLARVGDVTLAEEVIEKAITILEDLKNQRGLAEAKRAEGLIAYCKADWDKAAKFIDESEYLCEQIHDLYGHAETLRERAYMFIKKGDHDRAIDLLQKAREAFENIDARGDVILSMRKLEMLHNCF